MSLEETFTQTIEASPLYTYMRIAWHEQLSEGNETAEAISEKHVSNLASELVAVVKQQLEETLVGWVSRPASEIVDAVLFGEGEAER